MRFEVGKVNRKFYSMDFWEGVKRKGALCGGSLVTACRNF